MSCEILLELFPLGISCRVRKALICLFIYLFIYLFFYFFFFEKVAHRVTLA